MSVRDTLNEASEYLGDPEPAAYELVERLARDLAWAVLHMNSLLGDVEAALSLHRSRGGQHAGVPAMAGVPLSALLRLERDLKTALQSPAATETKTAALLRAALDIND